MESDRHFDGTERRQFPRTDEADRRLYDLHFGLERRHNTLDERVSMWVIRMQDLMSANYNNHQAIIAWFQRLYDWDNRHEANDRRSLHIIAGIGGLFFVVLSILAIKLYTL